MFGLLKFVLHSLLIDVNPSVDVEVLRLFRKCYCRLVASNVSLEMCGKENSTKVSTSVALATCVQKVTPKYKSS